MNKLRLSKSVVGKEEINAVVKVLENEYLGMGDQVKEFEENLSNYLNSNAICVNTGTSALQLAFQAIGLMPGDEVLVQSLTYVATYQAISATGAIPISCEVSSDTLTIDIDDARNKISKRSKAIVPIHYAGGVGDLDAIYKFARENKLRVVEDAAHAFGTRYKGDLVGSFGDICCFSFDGIKNITSGEGGAVVTKDNQVIDRIKDARLLGVMNDTDNRYKGKRSWEFDVQEQGWRYHMSNIMAAIGLVQLNRFPEFIKRRQRFAVIYQEAFEKSNDIKLIKHDYKEVVPHIFTIQVKSSIRDVIREGLNDLGIQTGFHYYPNHLLSKYKREGVFLPRTEAICDSLITLPLHPDLEEKEILFIANQVKSLISANS